MRLQDHSGAGSAVWVGQVVLVCGFCVWLGGCGPSSGPPEEPPAGEAVTRLARVRGPEILDPEGRQLQIRGIGLGNWLLPEGYMFRFERTASPRMIAELTAQLLGPSGARNFWKTFRERYVTTDDLRFLKEAGFNTVRVAIDYRIFTPEDHPEVWLDEGFQLLDALVDDCRRLGLYVILDLHGAPGGQNGENIDNGWGFPWLFESEASQARTEEVWRRLAARYRNEPAVLGYELLNEPIPHFPEYAYLNPRLEPLYRRITEAIRTVDPHHIIILGGAQWNTNFSVFGPPWTDNLVYAFHRYWEDVTPELIRPYTEFRDRYQVPVFMSESGENTDEWIRDFRELLESEHIGWCFWPYKKMETASCVVTIPVPEGWETIQAFAEREERGYEAVRKFRPDLGLARRTLEEFLEKVQFSNCRPNPAYLEALGLSLPATAER
ncbi:MAG TPA: glycoside hydrolase family 5 protein [Acidobacteriota bacterium]|nr:glycoside hydrolase family 5 protein [Acidobacteriota bacterium]